MVSSLVNVLSSEPHANRVIPLLDALAAICVHQAKAKQVYAVTMSLSAELITLTVAENEQVDPKVVEHLRDVLESVVEISRAVHSAVPQPRELPIVPPVSLIRKLSEKIYAFSHPRQVWRLEKRWMLLQPFLADCALDLGENLVAHLIELHRALSAQSPDFVEISTLFDMTSDCLASMRFDEHEWGLLEHNWVDKNQALVDEWKARGGREFAPYRCVAKLFSLHTHIKSILGVALSRRLSTYLSTAEVVVTPVAPYIRSTQAAPTMEDIDAAIRRHIGIAESDDEYEIAVKHVADKVIKPKGDTLVINAHCECSLVAYHLQNPNKKPLSYIGTSKLLCFACRIFFQFYNQRAPEFGQTPFCFKGAHWKLYTGGWAYVRVKAGAPDNVNGLLGRVREDMTSNLKTRIQERVRAQAKRRVVSNSTVTSTTPRSVIIGGESDIKEALAKRIEETTADLRLRSNRASK